MNIDPKNILLLGALSLLHSSCVSTPVVPPAVSLAAQHFSKASSFPRVSIVRAFNLQDTPSEYSYGGVRHGYVQIAEIWAFADGFHVVARREKKAKDGGRIFTYAELSEGEKAMGDQVFSQPPPKAPPNTVYQSLSIQDRKGRVLWAKEKPVGRQKSGLPLPELSPPPAHPPGR